jgi:hypothetical protein
LERALLAEFLAALSPGSMAPFAALGPLPLALALLVLEWLSARYLFHRTLAELKNAG